MRFIMAMVLAVVLIAAPAQAHNDEQVQEWVVDWESRVYANGLLSQELINEYLDFRTRHVCHFTECGAVGPSSVAVASGGGVIENVEQWRGLVEQYFPPEAVNTMLCIMWHESRGVPTAENPGSSATGIFQLMFGLWGDDVGASQRSDLHDPVLNVAGARFVWDRQGYWAWSPYKRGLCRGL